MPERPPTLGELITGAARNVFGDLVEWITYHLNGGKSTAEICTLVYRFELKLAQFLSTTWRDYYFCSFIKRKSSVIITLIYHIWDRVDTLSGLIRLLKFSQGYFIYPILLLMKIFLVVAPPK